MKTYGITTPPPSTPEDKGKRLRHDEIYHELQASIITVWQYIEFSANPKFNLEKYHSLSYLEQISHPAHSIIETVQRMDDTVYSALASLILNNTDQRCNIQTKASLTSFLENLRKVAITDLLNKTTQIYPTLIISKELLKQGIAFHSHESNNETILTRLQSRTEEYTHKLRKSNELLANFFYKACPSIIDIDSLPCQTYETIYIRMSLDDRSWQELRKYIFEQKTGMRTPEHSL